MRQFPSTRHEPAVAPGAIRAWRRERLVEAGFDRGAAERMAADPRWDLHRLFELVDRGCPPVLAARIVAPC